MQGKQEKLSLNELYRSPTSSLQVVETQREMILHLKHASTCVDLACNIIPLCNNAKVVWQHVALCRGLAQCTFPGCADASYVLSHYAQYCRQYCQESSVTSQSPKKVRNLSARRTASRSRQLDPEIEREAISILLNMNSPQSSPSNFNNSDEALGFKRKLDQSERLLAQNNEVESC